MLQGLQQIVFRRNIFDAEQQALSVELQVTVVDIAPKRGCAWSAVIAQHACMALGIFCPYGCPNAWHMAFRNATDAGKVQCHTTVCTSVRVTLRQCY